MAMKKTIKQCLALVLAITMISGLLPNTVFAVQAETADDDINTASAADIVAEGSFGEASDWSVDSEGALTITGQGNTGDYSETERPWEAYLGIIKSIHVESGITSIGSYTFADCPYLSSVTLAESVKTIDDYVFHNDADLTEIFFKGDAPVFGLEGQSFSDLVITAYYPSDNVTWISEIMQNYGGTVTWVSYCDHDYNTDPLNEEQTQEEKTEGKAEEQQDKASGSEKDDKKETIIQGDNSTDSESKSDAGNTEDDSLNISSETEIAAENTLTPSQDDRMIEITGCETLDKTIAFQHLEVNAKESDINFPEKLNVTVADENKEQNVFIEDVQWQIDSDKSSRENFDSSRDGLTYIYAPILPKSYKVTNDCKLPAITVGIGILQSTSKKRLKAAASGTSAGKNETGFIAAIDDSDASAVKISSAKDLAEINNNLNGSYVLANDIDLSDYGKWAPIGTTLSTAFRGKLDGQGHKITGLTVSVSFDSGTILSPSYVAGLFGVCNGAQIKNIAFENVNVSIETTSGYRYESNIDSDYGIYAGTIVGYAYNSTVIYNCHSSGTVLAKASGEGYSASHAGGLVGAANTTGISYCYNLCDVQGYNGNAVQAYDAYAGGLVGRVLAESVIERSYNGGTVTARTLDYGNAYAGGLIGSGESAAVNSKNCFNEGNVQGQAGNMFSDSAYAGGISGTLTGEIEYAYNSGQVNSQVNDPYGINNNAKSYAGGICGKSAATAAIHNCAIVQGTVYAGSSGTKYQYRISYDGSKSNNITISSVTSGSTNDADIIRDLSEMKSPVPYTDILGWDFSRVWEFVDGKDFPQLKQVDVDSIEYDEDYINQHLEFIKGDAYSNILNNYRWAQIYWSEENNFKSNLAGALYNGIDTAIDLASFNFGELFDDNNPFKIILADYISDQTVQEDIKKLATINVPYAMDSKYKKAESFIKENWKDAYGELTEEDLFWLYHYEDQSAEEWISQNFEDHLYEIVYDDKSEKMEKFFGVSSKVINKLIKAKDKYNSTVSWFNDLLKYSAEVDAYVKADEEYKMILEEMCNNLPESSAGYKTKLQKALQSYTKYNDADSTRELALASFVEADIKSHFVDKIKKYTQEKVKGWLKNVLSDAAFNKYNKIVEIADKTWKAMNYVTKNGDLQGCREMLRANAYFEDTMYRTLKVFEGKLRSARGFDDACMFDAAFKFFKETEIASMDIVIEYLDTYQTSWFAAIRNRSNSFNNSAIEEVHINKLFLYNTYCHGTSFELGGKVITVACPTNVYVYDENGGVAASIENNLVTKCVDNILAYTADSIKIITVPVDQEYSIKIDPTDNGTMSYSISEYNSDMTNVQQTRYEDVSIQKGEFLSGKINSEINTDPHTYNLTGSGDAIIDGFELVVDKTNVPVENLTIEQTEETLHIGDTCHLKATVLPENASVKTVAWSSSDTEIIRVNDAGEVTAVASGTATVTAQSLYGGVYDTVSFVVLSEDQEIYIKKQPIDAEYQVGDQAEVLSVEAFAANESELTYQWYEAQKEDLSDATKIGAATEPSYRPDTKKGGIVYYFVEVSTEKEKMNSNAAKITVYEKPPIAEGSFGDDVTWTLSADNILTISGNGEAVLTAANATIPWQDHAAQIKEIIVEKGITKIGKGLFAGCTALERLEIPFVGLSKEALAEESVLGAVFGYASSGGTVQYYELEGSSLHGYRYAIPESLKEVVITDAEVVPFGAFSNCGNLQKVDLNDDLQKIMQYSFLGCTGLKELVIPETVQEIQEGSLSGCSGLESLTVPFVGTKAENSGSYDAVFGIIFGRSNEGVVQYYSLEGTSLSGYTYGIPQGLVKVAVTNEREIPLGAFSNCSQMNELSLNSGITSVGLYAFYNCTGLTDVYFNDFESVWNAIDVDASGNNILKTATIHCIHDMKVIGHSLSLLGNIGVNYYVSIEEPVLADEDAYMRFELPDGTTEKSYVKDTSTRKVNNIDCYQFSCEIPSTQMTGEIQACLVKSDGTVSETDIYSAKTYADRIIANKNNNAAFAKAAPLVRRMLNYGGYAQLYFKYNDNPLANADLTEEERSLDTVTAQTLVEYAQSKTGEQAGISYYGSSLILKSETTIRHYFKLQDGYDISEFAFFNGTEELKSQKYSSYYYVDIPNIASDELDNMYTVSVGDFSITYSALSYAYSKLNKVDTEEELKDVLKAMYLYNQAANDYFGG